MTLQLGDVAPDFEAENGFIAGSVTNDEAREIYPDGWKEPRPYIPIVPQPS